MIDIILIILEQSFLYFPLILGAYFSISLMKLPNLGIESAYTFGAILASKCLIAFKDLPLSLLVVFTIMSSLLGGLIVGFFSGYLTQKAKIPFLLSSIMTIGLFYGINIFILKYPTLPLSQESNFLELIKISNRNPEFLVLSIIFLLVVASGFVFLKTELGHSLAVYGNNPHFFGYYGISTRYIFILGILISNSLAGLSGYLVVQSSGFVDINIGTGISLFCITTLILGKTVTSDKKVMSIFIPIVGIIFYCTIQQLLLKVGFDLKYFTTAQVIIVLVLLVRKSYRQKYIKIDNLGV